MRFRSDSFRSNFSTTFVSTFAGAGGGGFFASSRSSSATRRCRCAGSAAFAFSIVAANRSCSAFRSTGASFFGSSRRTPGSGVAELLKVSRWRMCTRLKRSSHPALITQASPFGRLASVSVTSASCFSVACTFIHSSTGARSRGCAVRSAMSTSA